MSKSIFSGIRKASASLDSNYEKPGHYLELITGCKTGETREGKDFAVVEKIVVHVIDNNDGLGHRVGESISHMMTQGDSFLGNIKAFIVNVLEVDDEEIDEETLDTIFGDVKDHDHGQPLAGTVVEVSSRNILTKVKKKDFTKVTYKRPVPASELLEILDAKVIERFFPENVLEALAKKE